MPPSTSRSILRAPISAFACLSLVTASGMKFWPPKPGFTLITRIRSTLSMTCTRADTGVAGLSATPAFLPSARIACSERRQPLHEDRPERDVGHEMAVHDIDMDVVGPRGLDSADFLAQPREIGGQYRRRDTDRLGCHAGLDERIAFMRLTAGRVGGKGVHTQQSERAAPPTQLR